MGNQLTGIAPSQILPVELYLTDIPDSAFECSLGSTRFFKVAKAKTKEGYTVVKVFVIHDPSLPLSSYKTRLDDICKTLQGTSNCLPFQRSVQQDRAALLFRQYVKDSLYDRISTRPFLNSIEKKWIAFQLLCALNQCHKLKVCHGDIKSENVMITGWNWLLLTDFASFKPTYLPEDNPSDFSYFFDTSRRRTCYIAPERFVESSSRNTEVAGQNNLDLTATGEVKIGDLTPAMDIFSAGCVITELFTEGTPPFDLSQLLAYRNKEYSPWKVLDKIDDANVRDLVRHMMQKDPNHRLSAEEYLIQQRVKTFPEYFYTFLKLYIQRFATPPILSPDDKIMRIKRDLDLILSSLKVDENRPENNSVLVLIISLLGSSTRQAHFCHSKLMALSLLTELSKYVTGDIILDRILPYIIVMAADDEARVRAEMLHCVTRCLKDIQHVPRSDANVFQEYIFSHLSPLAQDSATIVREAYAENIAQLAETALRVLEMLQLNEVEELDESESPDLSQSSYDLELVTLQEIIQEKVVMLLNDPDNCVKRALLDNGITRLCVFFGRQKANDILLSHMITFLNDKVDWHLRGAFFDNIVGIAAYVGWQSSEIVKPLLEQGLSDPEEFIVHKSLGALKSLTELGLLQKPMLHYFVKLVVPLLAHPGMWIRQGGAGFISAVAKQLNIADIHCNLLPSLQPVLQTKILQIHKEVLLLNALEEPIPRAVFDYVLRSPMVERIFQTLHERNTIREMCAHGHEPSYPEMDDSMSQIFKKLSHQGCTEEHEEKLFHMRDFILKLHRARAGSAESESKRQGRINIHMFNRQVTRRHADLYKAKDKSDLQGSPSVKGKKKSPGPDANTQNMNPEWRSMFGSNSSDRSYSTSPKSQRGSVKGDNADKRGGVVTPTPSSQSSSTGSLVNVSQLSMESSVRSGTIKGDKQAQQTRYAQCRLDLRTLVHTRRAQYSADQVAKDSLDGILWDSRPPPSSWRPKGQLVAHLHEHRAAVNRISVCSDHSFFATCSNDGLVKLWECGRLEGKNVANRSKQTLKQDKTCQVKQVTFFEGSHKLASATDTGSISVYELESGKATEVDKQTVNIQTQGHVVDMAHFDTGNQSVLAYATVNGQLIGWDTRSPELAWLLKNDPKTGLITSFAVHQSKWWLCVGTSSGSHVCWDLRFQLPITSIVHPAGSRVRRVIAHPKEQSWIISAVQGNNEVSMWDIETSARRKALWASSVPTFSKTTESPHAVYGMTIGVTDNSTFLLTGGSDMRVRFWDLGYPSNSFIMASAAGDPTQQTAVSYRSRLVEGTEVIEETYTKKQTSQDDIPRRGPDAPPPGHNDIITDVNFCQATQCLVLTSSRNGVIKVWK